ncbi:MAG: N-formylglutamate deformylase [Alphaproteobacteria bacterium]|nr:N-formylglutamate deformylase [Alphaproteobacteria bacterium]
MELYRYYPGIHPVVVNVPHAGTQLPPLMGDRLTREAAPLPDTDWYVDKLYNFARDMHVHLMVSQNSRYVVDLNRNKKPETLYPGSFNTDVVPRFTFDEHPIYNKGDEPDSLELQERIAAYWQPYHNKLLRILQFCIERYGKVVLLDAHSIRSEIPSLFEGELPVLNLGTANGTSAAADLAEKAMRICNDSPYPSVLNGRFKGGYITRNYGVPDAGCHVLQLEMAQRAYMNEQAPFDYSHEKAAEMQRKVLEPLIKALINWTEE